MKDLESKEYYIRRNAAQDLGDIKEKTAVSKLIELLKDDSEEVRSYAAEALGKIKDKRSILPLIEALKVNWNEGFDEIWPGGEISRSVGGDFIVPALQQFKIEDLKDHLLELMVCDEFHIQHDARKVLEAVGDSTVVEELIEIRDNHKDHETRRVAHLALTNMDRDRFSPKVQSFEDVVEIWERNLDRDRGIEAYEWLEENGQGLEEELLELLVNKSGNVKVEAGYALARLKDKRALPYVIEIFKRSERNSTELHLSAGAIELIGDDSAIPDVIEVLNNGPDMTHRSYAAKVLGELGGDDALSALIDALGHYGSYVDKDIARAIGSIADERAVEPLMELLDDAKDDDLRLSIVCALGNIGTPEVVPVMREGLNDKYRYIRDRSREFLQKMGESVDDQ